jgi:hypothetical protein
MKKVAFLLIALIFGVNLTAQTTFEKLYEQSDAIRSLGNDFFSVKKGSKWGVMKNNVMILDYYYDSIDVLSDGIITYIKNDQAGFADTLGNIITLAIYPLQTPYVRSEESILNVFQAGSALVYDKDKLILLGKDGKQINADEYQIISKSNNVVVYQSKSAYGLMDAMGNILAPNKYRRIETVIAGELYAYIKNKDGRDYVGLIDKNGEVKSDALYDDMTIISKNDKFYIKAFVSSGKQALFDNEGNQIFSPLYQNIEPLSKKDNYFIYTDNGRKGLIDRNYNIRITAAYDALSLLPIKNDTFVLAKNDNINYIISLDNKVLDMVTGNVKDLVSYTNNELIYIADSMLNYGIRSNKRGWLVEPKYLDIFAECKGTYIVREKDKWGGIDINGEEKIPFEYDKVRGSKSKSCIVFYDGKKNSILLKENGQKMEFEKTDNIFPMANYVEYKVKSKRYRLYFDGREIKGDFTLISSDKDGVICAKAKKGWSYFDNKTFESLTNEYYDMATYFSNGVAYVVKDKKLYQIDKTFAIVQTILDDNYMDLSSIASTLSAIDKLKKNYIILTDKNKKKTLLKINK